MRKGPGMGSSGSGGTGGKGAGDERRAGMWNVLLVSGCSGVGKSRVARRIARRHGASVLQVDDIRLALQRVTTPAEQPALHYFLGDFAIARQSVDEMLRGYVGVAEALAPALEIILAHHLSAPRPDRLVIEGDGILPRLAALKSIPGGAPNGSDLLTADRLRGVVVYEPEPWAILANMRARGRGIDVAPPKEQEAWARASWRYGLWLRDEALRAGVPALPARPYATLVARVLAAVTSQGGS